MKNGQLQPGYNLQIATNSQFVLFYDVYQNPTDTRTLIPFLNSIQETYGHLPEYIVADAGYGSEANYMAIIDNFNRTPLITYGMFKKDKTKKYKSDIFNTRNWDYYEINDEFICLNNQRLGFKRYAYRHDKYSFKRNFKLYECDDCSECPLKQQCMNFKSKTNKKIMKNYNRELGFVLMVLNIREVTAQRAENNQKNYNKDNFYIISIEIVFVYLSWDFMSHTPFIPLQAIFLLLIGYILYLLPQTFYRDSMNNSKISCLSI